MELPPVPGPDGQPRPPAAPQVEGAWERERHRVRVVHHQAADRLFVGPRRQGDPLLESVSPGRPPGRWRSSVLAAGYAVLPAAVVQAILMWFAADGWRWRGFLILAAVVAGVVVLFFWRAASDTTVILRAGARTVAEVDADGAGLELPLYELRSIGVTGSARGRALRVVGPNRQKLTLPLGLLEANQQLWDLVYNGIRHSEAAGAEIDLRTRELLGLPR